MPKIKCLCNSTINLSPIPNPQGFNLVWEPLIEKLAEDLILAHQQSKSDEEFTKKAYKLLMPPGQKLKFLQVYECSNCKRLVIFARASDNIPAFWFQQERANTEDNSLHSIVEKIVD